MNWFNDLSMRSKLLLLVVPPILILQLMFIGQLYSNWQTNTNMSHLLRQTELMRLLNPVVTELQRERGRTASFLGATESAQESAKLELSAQHEKSEMAMRALQNSPLIKQAEMLNAPLTQVISLRQKVLAHELSSQEAIANYSGLISTLMQYNKSTLQGIQTDDSLRKTMVYWAIAELTEMSGQERALGLAYLRKGDYNAKALTPLLQNHGQQLSLQLTIATLLKENELDFWQTMLNSPENQNLLQQRVNLIDTDRVAQVTTSSWYEHTTARIDRIVQSQQEILTEIVSSSTLAKDSAKEHLIWTLIFMTLVVFVGAVLGLMMVRRLNQQTQSLNRALGLGMNNKDLTVLIQAHSKDEMGTIALHVDELFSLLSRSLNELGMASDKLSKATAQNTSVAQSNTRHIEQQQQQVEQVATASEEMSSTSAQISQNVLKVAEAAQSVRHKSEEGESHVRDSVAQVRVLAGSVEGVDGLMRDLQSRSSSMIKVIDVIRNLAEQTNLLALNAAIEAARAGEHGRGFAVVADEVRKLAQQTHSSTAEIQNIIQSFTELSNKAASSMQESSQVSADTLRLSNELEQIFNEILTEVKQISDMSAEIATASEEQVAVSREVARSMDAIADDAAQSLTGAREIQQVAQEQEALASELKALASSFKTRSS